MKFFYFLFTIFILKLNYTKANLFDSIKYYSYIDTLKLKNLINNFNTNKENKLFLYSFYKFNYYASRKKINDTRKIINFLEKSSLVIKKEYQNEIDVNKVWFYSIIENYTMVDKLLNKILKSKNFTITQKVKSLNYASYLYSFKYEKKSAELIYNAIKIGIKDSNSELYYTYLNLASLNIKFYMMEDAKKNMKISLLFRKNNHNPILDYIYYNNYSIIHCLECNYNESIKLLKKCISFTYKYNLPDYFIGNLTNLAWIYTFNDNIDSSSFYSFKYYNYIKSIPEQEYNISTISRYYWLLGELYLNKNKDDSAFFFFSKIINNKNTDKSIAAYVYNNISNIYVKKKNKDSAYYFLNIAFNNMLIYMDSIKHEFLVNITKKIDFINIELKNKNIEIELLKKENKINFLKYSIMLVITMTSFFILLLINIQKIKIQKIKNNFTNELIIMQETFKRNLSMEIHDNIANELYLLTKEEYINKNEQILYRLNFITKYLKDFTHSIFPIHLTSCSLLDSINNMIYEIEKNKDFTVIKEINPIINQISLEKQIHIFRILQELLTNSIKYSSGKVAHLKINKKNNYILFIFKDISNTKFNESKLKKGFGINSIINRVEIIKGKIKFKYDNGLKVIITFKL